MTEAPHSRPTDRPDERQVSIEDALEIAVRAHRSGDLRTAEDVYRRILAAAPHYPPALHFYGLLHHHTGRSKPGVALIRQAIERDPRDPGMHNNLGNILLELKRPAEAAEAYAGALRIAPGYADAFSNRGAALRQLGRFDEAEECYRHAIEADPKHREAYDNLGRLLSKRGRAEEAIACHRRALELQPRNAETRKLLARAYAGTGDLENAAAVLAAWLEDEPASATARHLLAAVSGENVPERADDVYVETMFDDFAASFDSRLARLEYRAPALVGSAVQAALGAPEIGRDVLDAGCGTGLCGPLLKPYASRLVGVDLSSKMMEAARERAVYDELVHEELTAFLLRRERAFDLVVSADTLCYFGPLEPVLAAAFGALRPGGLLCFTVEEEQGPEDLRLNPHGRYSHAPSYVEAALAGAGFVRPGLAKEPLRREAGKPVAGLVVTAWKPET